MTVFGVLGFTSPWLLVALVGLPILWVILRAVPPSPVRRLFPGVVLLLGLKDEDQITDRTPWWLLLLRMLAVAAVILGLAGPVLNPDQDQAAEGNAPLLFVMDASWASATDWRLRQDTLERLLTRAGRQERPVALMRLTDPQPVQVTTADVQRTRLGGVTPVAWEPSTTTLARAIGALPDGSFDSYWLSDGLARDTRAPLLEALQNHGSVRAFESPRSPVVLYPAVAEDGILKFTAARLHSGPARELTLAGHGKDPAGNPAVLFSTPIAFDAGATQASVDLNLPAEMRARITRFEIMGQRSAGAIALPDDSLRRREIALMAGRDDSEGLELLSQLHYLRKALVPSADLLEGALETVLPANPDVIILADVARLSAEEQEALTDWLNKGGLLLRFAGPRLAASDISRNDEDPLMPVRLRVGGRSVGGAMSWGEPKTLAPFTEDSPFIGLPVPEEIVVNSQVMAQPDPTLADRVIAQLSDGTPLVTRKPVGQGQVILFHVTANADWSTLPLSGVFVQMLERLAVSSTLQPQAETLEGTIWHPLAVLDGFGTLSSGDTLPGVDGADLLTDELGPDLRPGVYQGDERSLARNVITTGRDLAPVTWPATVPVDGLSQPQERPLAGWLLGAAIAMLLADVLAALALSGRLFAPRAAVVLAALALAPQVSEAQDEQAILATSDVVFAHILTGDQRVDEIAHAGLQGLAQTLFFRTSVEPAEPISVDLETDELAFYPFLYWPISADQPTPSAEAYTKLNAYLRSGGLILFDTRDADIAGLGTGTANGRKLQELALRLDIPPLEPVPDDHVLTRAFYLLQDFPGRYSGRDVWVEAAPPDAEHVEGMPFRNLNDNVTPIVIGGNDWASAWAVDNRGIPLVPLARGFAGERQREIAYRFGVNLVMHVLTGNYKSDQVHVPALLDRLGQ
jgi:hypothetical protein